MIEKMNSYTSSSGNVFEDLGFEKEEAANLLIRADLLIEIREYIRESGMSLNEAAEFFGTTKSRISDLKQARVQKFGIDYLVNMLAKIGKGVKVEIIDLPNAA